MTTTKTCPHCNGTAIIRHFDAFGGYNKRCGACKGRKVVSAAKWLAAFRALPQTLSRGEAIARCVVALGLHADGSRDETRSYETAPNGVAGLVVDCEESGHHDVIARFLARWNALACEGHRADLASMVAEVRETRAMLRQAAA